MTTEKETGFLETEKRICKIHFYFPVRASLAVCKRWFVAADNYVIQPFVLIKSFKLIQVPLSLTLIFFLCHYGKVGIHHNKSNILPGKAVPAFMIKIGKPLKIILKSYFDVSGNLVIA